MRITVASLFLFAIAVSAQSFQAGTVVKWEMKPYSQSAHIIRDHVVYSIRVGDTTYQIARRSKDVEMSTGQHIDCRLEKHSVIVRNDKGKEIKYEIVGSV